MVDGGEVDYNEKVDTQKLVDNFPWGPIVDTHEVGNFVIAEFHPEIFKDNIGTKKYDKTTTNFHVFINGKSTSRSYSSLDMALIGAICIKHEGLNTQAPHYIAKMIGINE